MYWNNTLSGIFTELVGLKMQEADCGGKEACQAVYTDPELPAKFKARGVDAEFVDQDLPKVLVQFRARYKF